MSERLWQCADLPQLLAADMLRPANPVWSRTYSPELVYGRHSGPARGDARAAAVAAVFCWREGEWRLPLTLRAATLARHGGQVSFPGGLIDEPETPLEAASRELHEELGVLPKLEWLGTLSPQFVYASNAWVVPCVAATQEAPKWLPNPREVEQVVWLSLPELLAPPSAPPLQVIGGPVRFSAPQLPVEGHSAWGATAVMLGELRGRLLRISEAT
jgi:8-oxo-dGTP pyrophosphatase MutT (NUDIX family)